MRVLFYTSDKDREVNLATAFLAGARRHGHTIEQRALCAKPDVAGFDVVAMVGVKSKRLFDLTKGSHAVPLILDKGYIRTRRAGARVWEYWRCAIDAHHPTEQLMAEKMPSDRLDNLGLELKPWRRNGLQVVLAGSSAKYHSFYELGDPTAYNERLIRQLRQLTERPIIYRPKPSWDEAVPIKGSLFSRGTENILDTLANAWALVTHGSNACFEAALLGIPSIVLGNGVAAPISSSRLEDITLPKTGKREQWLRNLAYWQYTEAEMATGQAWDFLERRINERRP